MKAGFNAYANTASFQLALILSLHSTNATKISKQDLNKMLSITADTVFISHISFVFPDYAKFSVYVLSNDEYPIQISNIVVDSGTMIGIEKIV